ncbi:hypothetical protein NDA11_005111 [Ustilago hordei]|uniref:Uncharacterized protein n=1 Tax=Ustilago hordei TaxID=120017 RepID=I2G433_USTHO|nr:uncharacterized protein UHO2_01046 [Ustilago hordei]KAJ1583318.1 hypothetical protein NDA15_002470 [Ustilago hordei]KAJ1584690.1 hypothetical protein NDA11_005111 [Ustilago hordei]KAJ1592138.1 hypothetical protein NDA12_005943 [Ustilago hordei]KAJ1603519.1 hypothetical protein NDA14_007428 [Ustilago hordei]CCF53926.1 uncharacterized protein UHOR_00316 [Ustilago hordei]
MDDSEQDYEAIRQENIRKNAELMLSLGLNPTSTRLRPSSPERKSSISKRRSSPTDRATPDSGDQRSSSRKSSRIASGSRPRSYRERDLLPSIARPKQNMEKKLRQGTRKSSRASTSSRTKYTDWDSDEENDSDAYVPRWHGGSTPGQGMKGSADHDDDSDEANSSRGSRTFDLSGRRILNKLSNPAAPPLPSKGGDEIYEERMPLPSREHIVDDRGRGALIFEPEFSQFRPNVTPDEMLREGAFGGTAFRDYYSRVLQRDIDVEAELAELPEHWLEDLDVDDMLRRSQLEPSVNKFKAKAGQSLEDWEKAGWIRPIDPRGWFQWYYRFFLGRRSADDARQIGRWLKACGPGGRFRKSLAINVATKGGGRWDDPKVNPVVRQTLWQWGYDLTESDYRAYL